MDALYLQLLTGSLIGLGAGYVGSFMVLRRMSLVGDALSHVALPGIAIALLFSINPFFGAFAALFLAIVLIWFLEKRTELPSETLVGIMFTLSLALGLLLTPEPELLEALFGDITKIFATDLAITAGAVVILLVVMHRISGKLMLGIISKELAQAMKIPIHKLNFIFLFLVAVIVALGLKVVGTLLMGSLVIIPAAAAKNTSTNLTQYTKLSMIFGVLSTILGLFASRYFGISPGPTIVISAGAIFVATLFLKRK
ncbi:MAG: ABC-3 protein [Candidatus Yanofskybacteria bacterium GW2011_GWA2_44_9]|uniref:High-affinity zinc uptake system membrane protein ZnuB n=1 Tax=Candidatus Yanofskybacteria bacterium GW2011_GWA2_44_9 TaxID=1619025 RepID=A0A0G1MN18_9BACT|nr:MAG: ABC-3 protein [Candidatus Yanofskybacteria bacterium GW2011_GWA2_44_9]